MRLRYQFELIQLMRNFFLQQGFLDVLTPPAVENPGMEVHIHPFQLHSVHKKTNVPLYLHTSPEFCLKELLSLENEELDKIFSISYCFRDEPSSPIHRSQFLMLEWYRKNERYEKIMEDVEKLIHYCMQAPSRLPIRRDLKDAPVLKKTMRELFLEHLNVDVLNYLELSSIKELIKQFPEVPVPNTDLEWDDYFFLIYLNLIEPKIAHIPFLVLYEFPAPLSALSTLKESDPRVCERFELYIHGVEICNCFNELTSLKEQKKRFSEQKDLKRKLYGYSLPEPERFYHSLERGLPPSSGVALGVERLLHALCDVKDPFFY